MAETASTNWPLKGEETQTAVPIAGNPFPPIACTRKYFIIYSPSDVSVLLDPADAELLLVSQFAILLILLILLCTCARMYCMCYSLPAVRASVCDYANTCGISCSYMIIKK